MNLAVDTQLKDVVVSTLEISPELYSDSLSLGDCPLWDSLGHMNLIFSIESAFSVQFTSTEIPELRSVGKIKEALGRRA
jgi:acyl carrier protein